MLLNTYVVKTIARTRSAKWAARVPRTYRGIKYSVLANEQTLSGFAEAGREIGGEAGLGMERPGAF
jgi:hypothetical protein